MLTGNEAISAGAVRAGLKFYSAYPMTPASSILSYMAAAEKPFKLVVKHTEDEISAINMAIGASYAGARSMTGTSGGGFSLMVEGLGLAAMTETPLVVVEAQRPGPASGMATHSGQGDLEFIMHASPDEFPRVVIAPGDVNECFYHTIRAFNLAEKYQIPVLILTDKFLGESYWSTEEFDSQSVKIERGQLLKEADLGNETGYRRYRITENGVSPRSRPGLKNGIFIASSYEHDEHGMEREEEAVRVAMHDKRFRKLEHIARDIDQPAIAGNEDAEVTIVSWGSTKGPINEAMNILRKQGIKANYLQLIYISPFPAEAVKSILGKAKIIVDVENNKTGQLANIIREYTGMDVHHRILRYDGRAIWPEDLAAAIRQIIEKKAPKIIEINGCTEEETKDLDKIKMRTFKLESKQ
jgi:2-oxoglutarate ferredoxin oxidoreductase subunit alpha